MRTAGGMSSALVHTEGGIYSLVAAIKDNDNSRNQCQQ